ncbi:MAG: hypothetical protein M0Q24_11395 [Sulfurimonas sp.]|uniref:hypothetical protein n=1 Tax=Sulfurimonas sp. TaxID=2022749 RepID=UPI0025D22C6B|nr:hypothetical protein [Sulfurimonas sp.]MCK9492677.1 hypothetical protein [Sulfurimonas sp.]
MASPLTDLANEVVAALNASSTFSQTFTAELSYLSAYTPKDGETLRVMVMPAAATYGDKGGGLRSARRFARCDYMVDVGVFARVDAADGQLDADAMESMLELMDEIYLALLDASFSAPVEAVENEPVYDPKDAGSGLFVSVLSIRFRMDRRV